MKRDWTPEELQDHWKLLPGEKRLVLKSHRGPHNQLGFAALLKFFQNKGRFPRYRSEVPTKAVALVAEQLRTPVELYREYNWDGRSIKNHRAEIREFLKFREATVQDGEALVAW